MTRDEPGSGQFATFGALLKHLRRHARLTQQELGVAVGYSYTYIARLENSQRLPEAATVAARFVEALSLQDEPELARRLVELAVQARSLSHAKPDSDPAHTSPTNLMPPMTRFIGREAALAELVELLGHHRLVTLTGSGGVGKTRLAQEVGQAVRSLYPDGVWWVELAPLGDPSLMPHTVAAVFKLPDPAGRSHKDILDACAGLVEALLRGCPRTTVLATSREPLRIPGEITWRVPSLSTPDPAHLPLPAQVLDYEAVQLFIERAAAARPGFSLTPENVALIAQVAHRLDGIPLALEMAASQLYGLSLRELADRLDDTFALLTSGSRTALPRQQTLRATLDWSYDLLSEPEQVLLRRLSVFTGGWTVEAAEAVCADADQAPRPSLNVLPLLLKLVSKSLAAAGADARGEHTRFRLLEIVRQYTAERLMAAGEAETLRVRSRHLDYYLALTKWIEPFGPQSWQWVEPIEQELDNYRAALAWGLSTPPEDERGLRLAWALETIWSERGHFTEGYAWLSQALAKWIFPTPLRARALNSAGLLALYIGKGDQAREHLAEAVRLARLFDDRFVLADALARLSWAVTANRSLSPQERVAQAHEHLQESLRVARQTGHWSLMAVVQVMLAENLLSQGRREEARRLLEENLVLFQELNNGNLLCTALRTLAHCDMLDGEWASASAHLERGSRLARELGMISILCNLLFNQAKAASELGEFARAIPMLEEVHRLNQQLGFGQHTRYLRACYTLTGRVYQLHGDAAHAWQPLGESIRLARASGDTDGLCTSLIFLAALSLSQADLASAANHYLECLQIAYASGDAFAAALALAGLAEVARQRGHTDRAARRCGAAAAQGDIRQLAAPNQFRPEENTPTDWLEYDRTLAAMRALLGDPVLAQAWAEGERMTLKQAVDMALAAT